MGCSLGLQKLGQSELQMHISTQGEPYLRTLLVRGAQHILGPFGVDCDMRRCGLKLAESWSPLPAQSRIQSDLYGAVLKNLRNRNWEPVAPAK